jgi:uncharacterized membrane protein
MSAGASRIVLGTWLLLVASVAAWPFLGAGIGVVTATLAGLPLLLPVAGLLRASARVLRAAPMALAPALALAVTEVLVNPPARPFAALSLALAFASFAAIVAALRVLPRA